MLLPGEGGVVGPPLVTTRGSPAWRSPAGPRRRGRSTARMAATRHAIRPLIAETGGLNAMIVDSSALPEQVVSDVVESAFRSAGQRCSALRVLFLQEDIAPKVLEMLTGAMDELAIGDPGAARTDVGPVIDEPAREAAARSTSRRCSAVGKLLRLPARRAARARQLRAADAGRDRPHGPARARSLRACAARRALAGRPARSGRSTASTPPATG